MSVVVCQFRQFILEQICLNRSLSVGRTSAVQCLLQLVLRAIYPPAQERMDFNNSTSAVMCPFRPFALCAGTRRLGMTEVFPIMSRCVVGAASSSFYQQACLPLPVTPLALIPVSIPHVLWGKHPSGSSISPARSNGVRDGFRLVQVNPAQGPVIQSPMLRRVLSMSL